MITCLFYFEITAKYDYKFIRNMLNLLIEKNSKGKRKLLVRRVEIANSLLRKPYLWKLSPHILLKCVDVNMAWAVEGSQSYLLCSSIHVVSYSGLPVRSFISNLINRQTCNNFYNISNLYENQQKGLFFYL